MKVSVLDSCGGGTFFIQGDYSEIVRKVFSFVFHVLPPPSLGDTELHATRGVMLPSDLLGWFINFILIERIFSIQKRFQKQE